MNKTEVRDLASGLGIDLVGFTRVERLDARLPENLRPSQISEYLPLVIVLAKHIPTGISGAPDGDSKPLACGLVHRVLEESASELAYELEKRDYMAVVLPSLAMDFRARDELSNTLAGQGSRYLRMAAVEAGLGTLGLNSMLLTPRFGPRVYLGALMTNLELEPDEPIEGELCPGLEECGRCAAVCPAGAIPTRVRAGTPLAEYRDLDEPSCASYSQPFGVGTFIDHLRSIIGESERTRVKEKVNDRTTSLLWYHMTILRQGAFTGCSKCLEVCPVGEDYQKVLESPHRKRDLPADFRPRIEGEMVVVDCTGAEEPGGVRS